MSSSADVLADEAPTNAVDAVVADACEAQRRHGMIPTPIDNRQFIQPIVERMDNKPVKPTGSGQGRPDATRHEYERRGGTDFDSLEVVRGREPKSSAAAIPCTQSITLPAEDMLGLRARIRALGKRPEYTDRLKRQSMLVIGGQIARGIGDVTRARHLEASAKDMLKGIVDDSVRQFGQWWKPEPKIIVS